VRVKDALVRCSLFMAILFGNEYCHSWEF